ncbi:MAG: hypothetical protein ACYTGB_11365 [Planctomycetota bacterium]
MIRFAAVLFGGVLALGLLGCGSDQPAAGTPAGPAGKTCPSCPEGKCNGHDEKKCEKCPEGKCVCKNEAAAPTTVPVAAPADCPTCPGH